MQVSERLKNTNIINGDAFDLLRELKDSSNNKLESIIYVDSPYYGTESYYKKEAQTDKTFPHKELSEILLSLKGYIIIISYRATVTTNNKKTKNKDVQKELDKRYMNKGLFIQSKEVANNQIEILLTNVQVNGSTPYDRNIADLI